ncbi:MAG: hypothetical protein ACRC3J_08660 [Culicoidibacterales bacterium]
MDSTNNFYPQRNKSVLSNLFEQYEYVIVESLMTTFGLDWLVKDQYGGDVDTIHNVRKIDQDKQLTYKNQVNAATYQANSVYDSKTYHHDERFIQQRRNNKQAQLQGQLRDSYTGKRFTWNDRVDLDHTISAKEIHDDRGRILANVKGEDLANQATNLNATNMRTNRTKKAETMDRFMTKYANEYSDLEKSQMKAADNQARHAYEVQLAQAYYTSPKFAKDLSLASGKTALKMGTKQVLGFIFAEMWFAVKKEFDQFDNQFDLKAILTAIGRGIKQGFAQAQKKYHSLFKRFLSSSLAGALASLTTTLCNIFFTTAKNTVKIIRLSYASLVEALNILFVNPENYEFGERLRSVSKVIATGASIVTGALVVEALASTGIGAIPIFGELIQTFCGAFVTGIMSCTLLYFIDQSELMNKLVRSLDYIQTIDGEVNHYRKQAEYFRMYAAQLLEIDFAAFQQETQLCTKITRQLQAAKTPTELNQALHGVYQIIGVSLPWTGDFADFMNNKKGTLVFE